MDDSMKDQVGLVVGAAKGIGAAVVTELRNRGAAIVAVDQDPAVTRLPGEPASGPVIGVAGDCSDRKTIAVALDRARELPGRLSMLAYVAAYQHPPAQATALPDDEWSRSYEVTVTGAWQAAQLMAERAAAPAAIVHVASVHAYAAHPGQAGYGSAKAALIGLTRSLAVDLGPRGIRCNAVAPGIVVVERNSTRWNDPARVAARSRRIPLGRLGRPSDVARVVAFLLSADSAYVNGVCVPVDGGELALGGDYPDVPQDTT